MSLRSSIGRWRRIRERQRYHDPFCYGRDFIEEITATPADAYNL
jgi:hypothetical protein